MKKILLTMLLGGVVFCTSAQKTKTIAKTPFQKDLDSLNMIRKQMYSAISSPFSLYDSIANERKYLAVLIKKAEQAKGKYTATAVYTDSLTVAYKKVLRHDSELILLKKNMQWSIERYTAFIDRFAKNYTTNTKHQEFFMIKFKEMVTIDEKTFVTCKETGFITEALYKDVLEKVKNVIKVLEATKGF